MNELNMDLHIANKQAEYDEHVKNILAHKIVLAHIMASVVEEFQGMNPKDIVPLIEGEPQISSVLVDPGATNQNKDDSMPRISGNTNESIIPGEGSVTFDIHFYAITPDKLGHVKIILDVEAQKKKPTYDLVTRGIYYNARQTSAQWGREFVDSDYQNIKKVYSIWISMNSPKYLENTVIEYSIQPKIYTNHASLPDRWRKKAVGKYDLQTVIIIYLSKKLVEHTDGLTLHRFLGTLLSSNLSHKDKQRILEHEFDIPLTNHLERRSDTMCNLGEGIYEDAIRKHTYQTVIALLENGKLSDSEICICAGCEQRLIDAIRDGIAENDYDYYGDTADFEGK